MQSLHCYILSRIKKQEQPRKCSIASATFPVAAEEHTTALTRRRALFAALVATTMAAILWLASVAVPPRSFGAIAFLILFAVTLPWSVIGFWNAVIGFLIMRLCRDPATAVNPLAGSHPR